MIDVDQLPLEFGDEAKRLFRRFYPLLVERAWQDAGDVLGVDLAFDLANPRVQAVLDTLAEQVVAIVDTTRDEIRALIGRQAAEGWSMEQLADEIARLAETSAPRRALLIARTESATAYTRGALLAYQESGVVAEIEWLLGPEPCDICTPLGGTRVALGATFADGVMVPAHPNCTCSIAPIVG